MAERVGFVCDVEISGDQPIVTGQDPPAPRSSHAVTCCSDFIRRYEFRVREAGAVQEEQTVGARFPTCPNNEPAFGRLQRLGHMTMCCELPNTTSDTLSERGR
jgi:hypothetical protein